LCGTVPWTKGSAGAPLSAQLRQPVGYYRPMGWRPPLRSLAALNCALNWSGVRSSGSAQGALTLPTGAGEISADSTGLQSTLPPGVDHSLEGGTAALVALHEPPSSASAGAQAGAAGQLRLAAWRAIARRGGVVLHDYPDPRCVTGAFVYQAAGSTTTAAQAAVDAALEIRLAAASFALPVDGDGLATRAVPLRLALHWLSEVIVVELPMPQGRGLVATSSELADCKRVVHRARLGGPILASERFLERSGGRASLPRHDHSFEFPREGLGS
jgi:hypothetical protein